MEAKISKIALAISSVLLAAAMISHSLSGKILFLF